MTDTSDKPGLSFPVAAGSALVLAAIIFAAGYFFWVKTISLP
jgi:hypothetical protein